MIDPRPVRSRLARVMNDPSIIGAVDNAAAGGEPSYGPRDGRVTRPPNQQTRGSVGHESPARASEAAGFGKISCDAAGLSHSRPPRLDSGG